MPRPRHLEVEPSRDEHEEVVEPRDLALVAVVEEQTPRFGLRVDLVAAVEDRVEAPVVGDPVLLPAELAGLDHERVQVLEVRDQLRVPRLDEAALREVLGPADVRPEEIGLEARVELRERVRLVGHVRELRLVVRVCLHVLREHRLAAVVAVADPVEHLQPAALGCGT